MPSSDFQSWWQTLPEAANDTLGGVRDFIVARGSLTDLEIIYHNHIAAINELSPPPSVYRVLDQHDGTNGRILLQASLRRWVIDLELSDISSDDIAKFYTPNRSNMPKPLKTRAPGLKPLLYDELDVGLQVDFVETPSFVVYTSHDCWECLFLKPLLHALAVVSESYVYTFDISQNDFPSGVPVSRLTPAFYRLVRSEGPQQYTDRGAPGALVPLSREECLQTLCSSLYSTLSEDVENRAISTTTLDPKTEREDDLSTLLQSYFDAAYELRTVLFDSFHHQFTEAIHYAQAPLQTVDVVQSNAIESQALHVAHVEFQGIGIPLMVEGEEDIQSSLAKLIRSIKVVTLSAREDFASLQRMAHRLSLTNNV